MHVQGGKGIFRICTDVYLLSLCISQCQDQRPKFSSLCRPHSLYDVVSSGDCESGFSPSILDEAASVCEQFELWI
jgi:hypothetical protein